MNRISLKSNNAADSDREFLFAYGSLLDRSADFHREYPEVAEVLGQFVTPLERVSIPGILFDLDAYPGARPSDAAGDRVWGRILEIREPSHVFPVLDAYEDFRPDDPSAGEFIRAPIPLQAPDLGLNARGWMYWYNRSCEGKTRIAEGDYPAYRGPIPEDRLPRTGGPAPAGDGGP